MTNSNENFNPVYNNPLPPEFAHWSLDLYVDDDEFRAGYPFSDIPEMESNENWESYNPSPTFDDVVQSDNSGNNGIGISTIKENDQLTESSTEQDEKQMDGRLESCLTDKHHKNHETYPNQLNNYNKEEVDDDHLRDVDNQVNTIMLKKE